MEPHPSKDAVSPQLQDLAARTPSQSRTVAEAAAALLRRASVAGRRLAGKDAVLLAHALCPCKLAVTQRMCRPVS